MSSIDQSKQFIPLNIAVLTVSDTRSLGERGAGFLYPRLRSPAQAMVHDRRSAGHGGSLQHVRKGRAVATERAPDAARHEMLRC